MRRAERGLTLLEVLGAVALLGILYTVLAGNAIEGLRSEGESRRRLAASLLADEVLAGIELELQSGAAPPLGSTSEERDGFTVATQVRAFEPPPPRPDAARVRQQSRSLAARRAEAEAERDEAPSLFDAPASPTAPSPLRTIDVVVRWEEGIDAREVRRTTYALDAEAIEELFATVGDEAANRPASATGEDAAESGGRSRRDAQQPLPDFSIPLLEGAEGER
jgi:type II secretory pathway pseudopilin PulG